VIYRAAAEAQIATSEVDEAPAIPHLALIGSAPLSIAFAILLELYDEHPAIVKIKTQKAPAHRRQKLIQNSLSFI
jgi:hypothetical protein